MIANGDGSVTFNGNAYWPSANPDPQQTPGGPHLGAVTASIASLVAGVALLDLVVQAVHVSSQTTLLARHPDIGSRLIGGYIVFYSPGNGLGAIGATACFARGGWFAVTLLGGRFASAALAFWRVALSACRRP
ncbi:hypothetical protein [Luteibacter sp. 9135]|uniref:hypothetical protein n=1 Tax=Luteibacter sp. 9135 TaxID=1500893 RepID=UPI00055FCE79|nr:hypothetical protein [Luteibacter sp. 9135]